MVYVACIIPIIGSAILAAVLYCKFKVQDPQTYWALGSCGMFGACIWLWFLGVI